MTRRIIFLILFISQILFAQNDFIKKVKNTKQLRYFISNSKYQNKETNMMFLISCETNWFNSRVNLINSNEGKDTLKIIPCSNNVKIETIYIKGRKEILPQFYGRAEIQKWTFGSIKEAEIAKTTIEYDEKNFRVRIEKAPWIFWVDKNCLYFVRTAGQYMIEDLMSLEKILKK